MFDDKRSKKIIILSHCLLNQNSISDGTADFASQFTEIIDLITANKIGIVQLPCPELLCLGLDRRDKQGGQRQLLQENTRIRSLMSEEGSVELLKAQVEQVAAQIQEYRSFGFEVLGVVGINRSPSCGIETTTRDNKEEKGRGVFMELLEQAFVQRGQRTRMIGVKTSERGESVEKVRQFIQGSKEA